MSTRAQIGFYEERPTTVTAKDKSFYALIYRHSDGYPGTPDGNEYGVLADITPFLAWWGGARGLNDMEYLSARLLGYLIKNYDTGSPDSGKFGGTLGHGISRNFHGDIEYFYAVHPGGVDVYKVGRTKDYDIGKFTRIYEWSVS